MRFNKPTSSLLIIILMMLTGLMCHAQEKVVVKSVKSIYNREDQSKLRLVSESFDFQLFLDQSKLKVNSRLSKEQILEMASVGQIPGFQPNKLRRKVTDTEIKVMSRQNLPDEFSLGNVVYRKIELDLGEEDGKRVITEAYVSGSTADEIAAAATKLNFQWDKLGIDKTCKKPVCIEVKEKEDGTEICLKIRCTG